MNESLIWVRLFEWIGWSSSVWNWIWLSQFSSGLNYQLAVVNSVRGRNIFIEKPTNFSLILTQIYRTAPEDLEYSARVVWTIFMIYLWCFYFLFEVWRFHSHVISVLLGTRSEMFCSTEECKRYRFGSTLRSVL